MNKFVKGFKKADSIVNKIATLLQATGILSITMIKILLLIGLLILIF